jgi:hypothetical protein
MTDVDRRPGKSYVELLVLSARFLALAAAGGPNAELHMSIARAYSARAALAARGGAEQPDGAA